MLYPSVNQVRDKVDSRYTLVILAAKRAKEIVNGVPILTDNASNKPVTLSASEIAEDLISYKRSETEEVI